MKNSSVGTGIFLAVLAAALYAISSPLSKLLLDYMPSTLMAGFLYLGAGIGMGAIALIRRACHVQTAEKKIDKKSVSVRAWHDASGYSCACMPVVRA